MGTGMAVAVAMDTATVVVMGIALGMDIALVVCMAIVAIPRDISKSNRAILLSFFSHWETRAAPEYLSITLEGHKVLQRTKRLI